MDSRLKWGTYAHGRNLSVLFSTRLKPLFDACAGPCFPGRSYLWLRNLVELVPLIKVVRARRPPVALVPSLAAEGCLRHIVFKHVDINPCAAKWNLQFPRRWLSMWHSRRGGSSHRNGGMELIGQHTIPLAKMQPSLSRVNLATISFVVLTNSGITSSALKPGPDQY